MEKSVSANVSVVERCESTARVFISYSRKDVAFVDQLEAALKIRGYEPTIDRQEIYAFEDWWERIKSLISKADTIIFVLSPDSVKSDVALKEIAYGSDLNKRFAPIVYRKVDAATVPEQLRRLNFIFFDEGNQFEASADKLARALSTNIEWIRAHTEFGDAARRWIESAKSTGLLLRPPTLDQAEAWSAFRPSGAPEPTTDTMALISESRKSDVLSKRRSRVLQLTTYGLLFSIIVGLVGWINQSYISEFWRWYWIARPFQTVKITPHILTSALERRLKQKDEFQECASDRGTDYCPKMIVVAAGSFLMGAPQSEAGSTDVERPQHTVVIGKRLAVGKYPVTFDEWDTCVAVGDCTWRPDDGGFGRGQRPVIYVSWEDANQYTQWLSKVTGQTYRLLSEAEYEYAERAGTSSTYYWGNEVGTNNSVCAHCGSIWDNKQSTPVGSFASNKFGLYDMAGNVSEWVEDCATSDYKGAPIDGSVWILSTCDFRMIRGGSWNNPATYLRSASRTAEPMRLYRYHSLGFRVARLLREP